MASADDGDHSHSPRGFVLVLIAADTDGNRSYFCGHETYLHIYVGRQIAPGPMSNIMGRNRVLKLVTEFDTMLANDKPRIIQILEGYSQRVMDINDEQVTVSVTEG